LGARLLLGVQECYEADPGLGLSCALARPLVVASTLVRHLLAPFVASVQKAYVAPPSQTAAPERARA